MAKDSPTPRIVTKKHIARLERERRQIAAVLYIAIGAIIFIALLLAYGYLNLNYFQLRKPAAEVNGETITIGNWQERVRLERLRLINLLSTYQQYQQVFGLDTSQQQSQITSSLQIPETIGQQVLDQMVDEILIRQEAEKSGITVTDEEVDKQIQESFNFFANGTPTPTITPTEVIFSTLSPQQLTLVAPTVIPTEGATSTPEPTATPDLSVTPTATFTPAPPTPTFVPQPTATPYTLEGFKGEYSKTIDELKKNNISEAVFRSTYRNILYRQKLLEAVTTDTPQSEEMVWARHILVDDATAAQTVRVLLLQGQDFGQVAKDFSKDTGSAAQGGDLGWFGKGQMVPEFEQAAFSQKIGEIGNPVQSQFGYHIIQVLGHENRPMNSTQYEQARQRAFDDWLTKAREGAKIIKHDEWKQHVPAEPALGAAQLQQ